MWGWVLGGRLGPSAGAGRGVRGQRWLCLVGGVLDWSSEAPRVAGQAAGSARMVLSAVM